MLTILWDNDGVLVDTDRDPDAYLTALERYNLHPADCMVVEDSERGLAAARAANLECLVVQSEWTKDGDFHTARKVLESIRKIPDEVLLWAGKQACFKNS